MYSSNISFISSLKILFTLVCDTYIFKTRQIYIVPITSMLRHESGLVPITFKHRDLVVAWSMHQWMIEICTWLSYPPIYQYWGEDLFLWGIPYSSPCNRRTFANSHWIVSKITRTMFDRHSMLLIFVINLVCTSPSTIALAASAFSRDWRRLHCATYLMFGFTFKRWHATFGSILGISSGETTNISMLAFRHLIRLSSTFGGRLAPILTILAELSPLWFVFFFWFWVVRAYMHSFLLWRYSLQRRHQNRHPRPV
jgi:hypothetical protein